MQYILILWKIGFMFFIQNVVFIIVLTISKYDLNMLWERYKLFLQDNNKVKWEQVKSPSSQYVSFVSLLISPKELKTKLEWNLDQIPLRNKRASVSSVIILYVSDLCWWPRSCSSVSVCFCLSDGSTWLSFCISLWIKYHSSFTPFSTFLRSSSCSRPGPTDREKRDSKVL